ncbi:MAG: glycosyl transferase family 2 [Candidatus Pacebacteria bacterium CG_4_10_14_0_8_um_filter_43_12]|nr:MAG: glycosyl transferase family 2 [Candidatus Pacebacteria bacterium CG_4_10_14_0_8_um_filter_43_12]
MKVVAVMPAYNAAKTLEKTLADLPKDVINEIILVDDHSTDQTAQLARKLGLTVVEHPQNRGYGGNQKTCYTLALSNGADVVVMIHPDYQYDSSLADKMVLPIIKRKVDVMLGSRIRTRKEALAGGMPLYKYLGNRFLTLVENFLLGQNLSEYHTGYRAFSKEMLEKLPFHKYSDDFVFDSQILFGAIANGARIDEIRVPVRYFQEASSINFFRSCIYGFSILRDLGLYLITRGRYFI